MHLIHTLKTDSTFRTKFVLSLAAGLSLTLTASHHFFNFWGVELWLEALILLVFPLLFTYISFLFLDRIWVEIHHIPRWRWWIVLIPVFLLSPIFTYATFFSPSVWHTIEIQPLSGVVDLYEIKTPPGRVAKFANMDLPKGWDLSGDRITASAGAEALTYSFRAPIGQPVNLLFGLSKDGGVVEIKLDGKNVRHDLHADEPSLAPFQIDTSYKLGIPALYVLGLIILADLLTFSILILAIWLVQEVAQESTNGAENIFVFSEHRLNLWILLGLGVAFHAANFLSVPLITASDSPSYLHGVTYWLKHHNLDGVPAFRGPGTTFLFIPVFLIFGDNPAGIKLLMHLLALGVIFILYMLGWRLYRKPAFAFLTGLVGVFIPELYLYANFVHHDVPSIFFIALYSLLLLIALEDISWRSLLTCFIVGSFVILLRPENLLLLAAGMGFAGLKILWEKQYQKMKILILSALVAAMPLLWWSAHNNRVHGFFGLSNYFGMVLYDGWIYYGEAGGFHISDPDSPSIQAIAEAVKAYNKPLGETVAPTGPEVYPALIQFGYTHEEAMALLGGAAKDSLRKDPALTWRLYRVKIRKAFIPPHNGVIEQTYTPIEKDGRIIGAETAKGATYFHFDDLSDPTRFFFNEQLPENTRHFADSSTPVFWFIPWQQKIYAAFAVTDNVIYRPLVFFSLVMAFLALYQKRFFKWVPLISLIVVRMFFPISVGNGQWSFMLGGIALLLCCAPLGLDVLHRFILFTKKSAA